MTKLKNPQTASAAVPSFSEPLGQLREHDNFERVSTGVLLIACLWLVVACGGVLAGWALADETLIHFPTDRRYGTMMPLTAVSLLMFGSALWLRRFKYAKSVGRRQFAVVLTAIPTLIGALVMWEYARDIDLGMDLIVFPEKLASMLLLRPGRPSPGTALSLFILGLALLCVDAKSKRVQRISEVSVLFVALLGAVRMIGFVFGEVGMYAPSWQVFGTRVFQPMSPTTASCIFTTAIGLLFARPHRCAVRFLLMAGPAGIVARSLIPAALILPVVLGWLGLLVIRGGLVDTQYPLSLVVAAMIVLLLGVISMNARAIRRIHDAQQRLTAILDATPDFVGIIDVRGNAMYVNQAGRIMTGVDDAEITALTVPDFHPVASADRIMKEGVPAAKRDGVWTGETELMGGHGDHIPVSQVILAHKDSSGEVAYLSTIMRDITHQKQLEDSQRFLLDATRVFSGSLESDAILMSMLKLVVPHHADYCLIDLLGEDGRIHRAALSVNRGPDLRERLRVHPTGKKPNPVIARVVKSGEPLIVPVVTSEWLSGVTRGRPHPTLLQKLRPRSTMIVPMRGRRHMLGVICYSVTQSEKRYADQDMQLARELASRVALALENAELFMQSQGATRIRDEVLRVVAHDLRNPLNTVSLTADLLRDQMPNAEPQLWADKLNIIERSVAQADRLIEDLLDVARMEAGHFAVEPQPTDVHALTVEAIELYAPLAADHNIRLFAELPSQLGAVYADPHRVLQVFSNLIGNAIKFSPSGSQVVLHAAAENGAISFGIRDNGPGISEKDIPHLFDPFWQARKGNHGAGLGLPIAKAIVEAHRGKIWVESKPGAGSTFWFTLPAVMTPSAADSLAAD